MDKISIIGMSCLFPGAKTLDEFWNSLLMEKDETSMLTIEKIDVEPKIFYDPVKGKNDRYYNMRGGFIQNFSFDPAGYDLPGEVLEKYDDLFKWSLHVSKQALMDSGYWGKKSLLKKCGIILGNLSTGTSFSHRLTAPIYQHTINSVMREVFENENFSLKGFESSEKVSPLNFLTAGYPAAVISQALSLQGIRFSLDAACASSLYAIKLASEYLLSGEADLMLAGAVSCPYPVLTHMVFSNFQAYPNPANNEESKPLDKSSTGILTSEGAGMLVLKRYEDAVRDGDKIYANILGVGLSNDGRGKHLLSPNSKGQILAFERAYTDANVSADAVEYVECHATGTPLGDKTELDSMESYFGKYGNAVKIGSVKSNIGHLLSASGMASVIKVILSMNTGKIPATIKLTDPLRSSSGLIGGEQSVKALSPWPGLSPVKVAGINSFGFGGNNAHLVLEQGREIKCGEAGHSVMERKEYLSPRNGKMAIVGMEAFWGGCDSLKSFDKCIYNGEQKFTPVPQKRWTGTEIQKPLLKDYGFMDGEAPLGAYIEEFDLDFLHCRIPPDENDQPISQQLLVLKVADKAIRDAGIKEGGNVAVIIAMETESAINQISGRFDLVWQIKESLERANIHLPPEKLEQLETALKDSITGPINTNQYISIIGNIMASRISNLWDFSGPSFTLSTGENSVFRALDVAQFLLADSEIEAVVVGAVDLAGGAESVLLRNKTIAAGTYGCIGDAGGWVVGEGAGAVVLKRVDEAKKDQNRVYAVIDAVNLIQLDSTPDNAAALDQRVEAVQKTCIDAFAKARISPKDIGYLEVYRSGFKNEDEPEIIGLMKAYKEEEGFFLRTAIGSVKTNIGHSFASSGMASLIKTALCLYNRYIPMAPVGSNPKNPDVFSGSPFYSAAESRPWNWVGRKRYAAINGLGNDDTFSHIILSEEETQRERENGYAKEMPLQLFLLGASDCSDLLEQLKDLEKDILNCSSLAQAAQKAYNKYRQHAQAQYVAAIVGQTKEKLNQEIASAFKGIPHSFECGKEWSTPQGSYFTANPLGKKGSVSFVYPGAFNSYQGMLRELFRLFPKSYDALQQFCSDSFITYDQLLYPRSQKELTKKEMQILEESLIDNADAMLISGIGAAMVLTKVFRDYFKVEPKSAFGYSLGEYSMLSSLNAMENSAEELNRLNSSQLFKTQISGPKNAIRELWGIRDEQVHSNDIWGSTVLLASPEDVLSCIKNESRVYLTHINTPAEVVIAGDPISCERVIKRLNCSFYRAPYNQVLHCEAMSSLYSELVQLFSIPMKEVKDIDFYFGCDYKCSRIESSSIAQKIAKSVCQRFDFPRLIKQLYNDGARIFVELGPGSTCSRWIHDTLGASEHVTVSTNNRSAGDYASLIKALSILSSHQVPIDLSCLYGEAIHTDSKQKKLLKKVTLGGTGINLPVLYDRLNSLKVYKDEDIKSGLVLDEPEPAGKLNVPVEPPIVRKADISIQEKCKDVIYPEWKSNIPNEDIHVENVLELSFQAIRRSRTVLNKAHVNFLRYSYESMGHIGRLMRLQSAVGQHPYIGELPFSDSFNNTPGEFKKDASLLEVNKHNEKGASKSAGALYNETDLMEFANGKISNVFGKNYEVIDSYSRRIRLPLPPYHFISRVTKMEAKRGCFEPCSIETEYDIPPNAWYSVGGQAPFGVVVEATHGVIFLVSYLGCDFEKKGERGYRALNADITVLDEFPREGETLRYQTNIDSFTGSEGKMIFNFSCKAFAEDRMVLKYTGSAGLFTPEQLEKGQGIVIPRLETKTLAAIKKSFFEPPVICNKSSFSSKEIHSLIDRNLADCFGPDYAEKALRPFFFASRPMLMIDRIISIDRKGGNWGLGLIIAEKTLLEDDWYFKCHFKHDYCMPGTLVGEGCMQVIQFYMLYLGLHMQVKEPRFQPVPNITIHAKNRGQVTPVTSKLVYKLEITNIGLDPVPFVIGNAEVIFNNRTIATMKDIGIQIVGVV